MNRLPWIPIILILLAFSPPILAQEEPAPLGPGDPAPQEKPAKAPVVAPFESLVYVRPGPIDELVSYPLGEKNIPTAHPCSESVFVRRVFLDLLGTLPTPREVLTFLQNRDPHKRSALINALLARAEFADYWSLKWGDLLRVKAEFPINLWPNGVQAYHRWIHESVRTNKPYDQFVRELLTSSGSNFRVPPVNFYRAIQGKAPSAIANAVALTFMGVRLEEWPKERRAHCEAFFSRVAFKGTAEWKEEIVYFDPAPAGALDCVFPDGTQTTIPPGTDPRGVFADWLITSKNEWFSRNIVNRLWSWLMGRGIIHEPDDIRPDNPPSNPDLLAYLQWELTRSGYDLRHMYRLILNSRTYQQSSIPQSQHPDAGALFAFYPVRQLSAEVLADAFRQICGARETYSSMIPEPFTWIPPEQRSILLSDGSITSPFLEMFGRPSRDTGLESERNNNPSDAQRLFLINSSGIQRGLSRSPWLRRLVRVTRRDHRRLIRTLYLTILSRLPTAAEVTAVEPRFTAKKANRSNATIDLAWALINTKEFLYRH
ncbi:MAG: DUF1553 domain-containing protein [Planctomycetota bacterium]|jgi:hypothetical protein